MRECCLLVLNSVTSTPISKSRMVLASPGPLPTPPPSSSPPKLVSSCSCVRACIYLIYTYSDIIYQIYVQHISLLFPALLSRQPTARRCCASCSSQSPAPAPLLAPARLPQHLCHHDVVPLRGLLQWGLAPLVQHTHTGTRICYMLHEPLPSVYMCGVSSVQEYVLSRLFKSMCC